MVGGGQADGSDAAVGIQHHFFAGEMRRVHRKAVQHFGLGVIDLIKAAWADSIGLAAEGIQNEALAVQHLFHIAQHHAGFAVIHVLDDGGDGHALLSGFGQQGFNKVLGTRQHRLSRHQRHHHLPGHNTPPQQAVTQKAGALILIKRLVMAGARCRTHGQHGLVQHFVLQKAAFHRQHLVAVCRVDAGGKFSTPAGGKGGDDLVPIVVRRFHAPDVLHRAESAQQLFHGLFFLLQLCGVVHAQHRAAAAVLGTQFAIHNILPALDKARKNHYTTNRKGTATSGWPFWL